MSKPTPLVELEIVGYVESIPIALTPRILPPLLRVRDSDPPSYILPPYEFAEDRILSGVVASQDAVHSLTASDEATLIPIPLDARPNHILWMDDTGKVRYEPAYQVLDKLRRYATAKSEEAWSLVYSGDLAAAAATCDRALAADDRCLDAVYAKAVMNWLRGMSDRMEIQRQAAQGICETVAFDLRLNQLMWGVTAPFLPSFIHELSESLTLILSEHLTEQGRGAILRAQHTVQDLRQKLSKVVPKPVAKRTLLIVEDEDQVRFMLASELARAGYRVRDASDVEEARQIAKSQRFDMVIVDYVLGGMKVGGDLALELVRSQVGCRPLLISGFVVDSQEVHGLEIMAKPFAPEALIRKVGEVLGPVKFPPGTERGVGTESQ